MWTVPRCIHKSAGSLSSEFMLRDTPSRAFFPSALCCPMNSSGELIRAAKYADGSFAKYSRPRKTRDYYYYYCYYRETGYFLKNGESTVSPRLVFFSSIFFYSFICKKHIEDIKYQENQVRFNNISQFREYTSLRLELFAV